MSSHWQSVTDTNFIPAKNPVDMLETGTYTIEVISGIGTTFKKIVSQDSKEIFYDTTSLNLLKGVDVFLESSESYRLMNISHKRGYLLWGPPGTGKTTLVKQISQKIIEKDGLVFYCSSPYTFRTLIPSLQQKETNRKKMIVFEDVDTILSSDAEKSPLLAMLDGEYSLDHTIVIATTNYPEKLEKNIINRPSRFDEIIYIGPIPYQSRFDTISRLLTSFDVSQERIKEISIDTEGFSVAHIKELIVAHFIHNKDYPQTLKVLRKMRDVPKVPDAAKFGFEVEENDSVLINKKS